MVLFKKLFWIQYLQKCSDIIITNLYKKLYVKANKTVSSFSRFVIGCFRSVDFLDF